MKKCYFLHECGTALRPSPSMRARHRIGQLHEAAEIEAAFIARHAGCDPDAELTKLLTNQSTNDRS